MEHRWQTCRDKLSETKPEPEMWIYMGKYSCIDEVVVSRMRLGHTLLTHGYLMDNDSLMKHLIVNFVLMRSCLVNTLWWNGNN